MTIRRKRKLMSVLRKVLVAGGTAALMSRGMQYGVASDFAVQGSGLLVMALGTIWGIKDKDIR